MGDRSDIFSFGVTLHELVTGPRPFQERNPIEPARGDDRPFVAGDGQTPPALQRILVTVSGARFNVHPSDDRILVFETSAPSLQAPLTLPIVALDWAMN